MVSEADRPASAETPNDFGAFPRLEPAQVDMLAAHGDRRPINPGDVLYREGEVVADFFVVLAGSVAIVEGFERDDRVLTVHGPGRFLGELSLLVNQPAFVTAVAQEAGEVLAVPVTRLRQLVADDPDLGDLILRAYLARRALLIESGSGFKIIGSRYSPDTRRLRDFAARNRLPHKWIDLEADDEAESLLQSLGITPADTPVVIWRDETVLRNPSNRDIARIAGLPVPSGAETICDLGIVGAGPAGLAAAVYGASEGLDTVILDGVAAGGQAGTSSRIENYLAFPSGISGWDLAQRALLQARKFGARILVPAEATALEERDGHHVVVIEGGTPLVTRTLVIATGAGYRKLDVPGIDQLEPACIHYAATQLETNACAAIPVAVVGGGNSAAQAALSLARRAQRVHLVLREAHLTENMSRYLADRIKRDPNIDVHCHNEVRELIGSRWLDGVVIEDIQTGERKTVEVKALFVFIGAEPCTGWLRGQLDVDDAGFIRTGHSGSYLETSRPGVFAAGDVRSGSVRRVASAVGDGAMVVRLVHKHLGAVRL